MERNHLKGRNGDRADAVVAAAGYKFSLLIQWLRLVLRQLLRLLNSPPQLYPA